MIQDTLVYDDLIAGDVDIATQPITIGPSQAILRGDLLELTVTEAIAVSGATGTETLTPAANYVRPSGAAKRDSHYVVATEPVTTDSSHTAASIGYKSGQFNALAMRFGGSSVLADNQEILSDKSIYLVIKQPA
jgi:hypothetical protein